MPIIFLLPWLEEPQNSNDCIEKCRPPIDRGSVQYIGYQTAAENSHIVLPRICMKYQNIFCRLRIMNNVCILYTTAWGRSQVCDRQAGSAAQRQARLRAKGEGPPYNSCKECDANWQRYAPARLSEGYAAHTRLLYQRLENASCSIAAGSRCCGSDGCRPQQPQGRRYGTH